MILKQWISTCTRMKLGTYLTPVIFYIATVLVWGHQKSHPCKTANLENCCVHSHCSTHQPAIPPFFSFFWSLPIPGDTKILERGQLITLQRSLSVPMKESCLSLSNQKLEMMRLIKSQDKQKPRPLASNCKLWVQRKKISKETENVTPVNTHDKKVRQLYWWYGKVLVVWMKDHTSPNIPEAKA